VYWFRDGLPAWVAAKFPTEWSADVRRHAGSSPSKQRFVWRARSRLPNLWTGRPTRAGLRPGGAMPAARAVGITNGRLTAAEW